MHKKFAWLACVGLSMAFSCPGLAAQQLAAQQVDPSIAAKLPTGAKVHLLTDDEFQKLVAKGPRVVLKGTESRAVVNPKASAQKSSLLAGLSTQKQGADADLLTAKSAGPAAKLTPTPSLVVAAPKTNITPAKNLAKAPPTGAAKYAVMPATSQINGCVLSQGQMAIGAVAGQLHIPLQFTPISQYNLYSIHGCNFGDSKPGVAAWIYGLGFREDFQIEAWTDQLVVLKLDDNISGVLDQDNLQLVVHRADGKEVQAGGFKFYAARDENVLLMYIPATWQALDFSKRGLSNGAPVGTQRFSPVNGSNVPQQATGSTSIYVHRQLNDKFDPGLDTYDFSQLPQGWLVQGVSSDELSSELPERRDVSAGFRAMECALE